MGGWCFAATCLGWLNQCRDGAVNAASSPVKAVLKKSLPLITEPIEMWYKIPMPEARLSSRGCLFMSKSDREARRRIVIVSVYSVLCNSVRRGGVNLHKYVIEKGDCCFSAHFLVICQKRKIIIKSTELNLFKASFDNHFHNNSSSLISFKIEKNAGTISGTGPIHGSSRRRHQSARHHSDGLYNLTIGIHRCLSSTRISSYQKCETRS